jgi:hypothetical protein
MVFATSAEQVSLNSFKYCLNQSFLYAMLPDLLERPSREC